MIAERLVHINKSYVYITHEPHAVNSNLYFAADEFEFSKKDKEAVAVLAFRIVITHPFAQGNKRTANAAIELFYDIDGEKLKHILLLIASNNIDKEEAVKRMKMIMGD